jgi:hypothetical protein
VPKEGVAVKKPAAPKPKLEGKLPSVPESVLLRRKRRDAERLHRIKSSLKVTHSFLLTCLVIN